MNIVGFIIGQIKEISPLISLATQIGGIIWGSYKFYFWVQNQILELKDKKRIDKLKQKEFEEKLKS